MLRKVDGVVIVGWVGRNSRDLAVHLNEALTGAGAPLLGIVANGVKRRRSDSYVYAYDYAADEDEPPPSEPISSNGASPHAGTRATAKT